MRGSVVGIVMENEEQTFEIEDWIQIAHSVDDFLNDRVIMLLDARYSRS